ncbi:DciA family protein [Qaidamihabitans albus]|uniref:DciA family protein n=1 Tax=Qaidamihabitans albus TaxID=2795733 RepID=UPI003557F295
MNALSPRVTSEPNEDVNTPQVGGTTGGSPERDTERNTGDGPIGLESGEDATPPESSGQPSGRDLARAALNAARARAGARGTEPGVRRPGRQAGRSGQDQRRRRWSGAGVDERDPQPLGRLVSRMAGQLGWGDRLAHGQVFGRWNELVGEEVAEHAQPVTLKDGELTVRASSTAWATQLRLLQRQLLKKIAAGVGHGVVKRMRIQGPTAPSWRKGPRHVPGRGPRDTYG